MTLLPAFSPIKKSFIKKYWYIGFLLLITVGLGVSVLITSIKLQDEKPIAPTVPQGKPHAVANSTFEYTCLEGSGRSGFKVRMTSSDEINCPDLSGYQNNWNPASTLLNHLKCPDGLTTTNNVSAYKSRHKLELISSSNPKTIFYRTSSNFCPDDPCGQATQGIHGCYENLKIDEPNPKQITLVPGVPQDIFVERIADTGYACGSYQTDVIPVEGGDCRIIRDVNISAGVCDTGIPCLGVSPTVTMTHTPSPTQTLTQTPTNSMTPTNTVTITNTPTNNPSNTATPTSIYTNTPTSTLLPTPTSTQASTQTPSSTSTSTPTPVPLASCNNNCNITSDCLSGYACINGFCRNPSCSEETNCICPVAETTPTIPVDIPVTGGFDLLGSAIIGIAGILLLFGIVL